MIEEFQEWKENQSPFISDQYFFEKKYNINLDPFMRDVFRELYFTQKKLDELEQRLEVIEE